MTVNKMKLFTLGDAWPWLLVTLLPTALIGQAIRYSYFQTNNHIGWIGWTVFSLVLTAFYGITIWRYILRSRFLKSIIGYTQDGVGVTLACGVETLAILAFPNAPYGTVDNSLLTFINTTMENVLSFWNAWAVKNNIPQQTVGIFNGCFLSIENEPIQTIGIEGKLAGLEIGGQISVVWNSNSLTNLTNILSHETGHHCLDALGYRKLSSDQQHQMFKQAGFNY